MPMVFSLKNWKKNFFWKNMENFFWWKNFFWKILKNILGWATHFSSEIFFFEKIFKKISPLMFQSSMLPTWCFKVQTFNDWFEFHNPTWGVDPTTKCPRGLGGGLRSVDSHICLSLVLNLFVSVIRCHQALGKNSCPPFLSLSFFLCLLACFLACLRSFFLSFYLSIFLSFYLFFWEKLMNTYKIIRIFLFH